MHKNIECCVGFVSLSATCSLVMHAFSGVLFYSFLTASLMTSKSSVDLYGD